MLVPAATSSDGVSIRFTLQYQGEDICPLWVWDSSENTYKNEYVVDELPENESVSIPIDPSYSTEFRSL